MNHLILIKHGRGILKDISWEEHDFSTVRMPLPPLFFEKLLTIKQAIDQLFEKLAQQSESLDILKHLGESELANLQEISITQMLQAPDHDKFLHTMANDSPKEFMRALGSALASYFKREYFYRRYLKGEELDEAPLVPIVIFTNNEKRICLLAAPGVPAAVLAVPVCPGLFGITDFV